MIFQRSNRVGSAALKIVKALKPGGMSDDEHDDGNDARPRLDRALQVIPLDWRSDEVIAFVDGIDNFGVKNRHHGNLPGYQPYPRVRGNRPRVSAKIRKPIPGLPINCYRPEWLDTLSALERLALNVQVNVKFDFKGAVNFDE